MSAERATQSFYTECSHCGRMVSINHAGDLRAHGRTHQPCWRRRNYPEPTAQRYRKLTVFEPVTGGQGP